MSEKFRFKPEMFYQSAKELDASKTEEHAFEIISFRANELLDAYLATLPKYYGVEQDKRNGTWLVGIGHRNHDTHLLTAWSIEPLKRECVEHEPDFMTSRFDRNGEQSVSCKKCGAKLKATWSAE